MFGLWITHCESVLRTLMDPLTELLEGQKRSFKSISVKS